MREVPWSVRQLDAAFAPGGPNAVPRPWCRGPKIPRRRQAVALQGAFGTGIFKTFDKRKCSRICSVLSSSKALFMGGKVEYLVVYLQARRRPSRRQA